MTAVQEERGPRKKKPPQPPKDGSGENGGHENTSSKSGGGGGKPSFRPFQPWAAVNKHPGILEHHLGLAGSNPGSAFRVVQMRNGLLPGGFAHLSPLHHALVPGAEGQERLILPPLPPHLPPGLRLDETTGS